jgi:peptidoglycan/LPS O-acetylase OafA/YrhL
MPSIHFEHFDALRFLAFLVVFISHAAIFLGFAVPGFDAFKHTWLTHGDLGVSFFFVLSGFLITRLLLAEQGRTGTVSLPHFYLRRILRIWPVYFLVFIVGFFIIPLFAPAEFPFLLVNNGTSPWWFIFFLVNIKLAFSYAPPAILAVLWSISVEEQFYLLWPLAVRKLSIKNLIILLIGVIIGACWYRFDTSNSYGAVHYFTISTFSDIAIGALAGLLTVSNSRLIAWIQRLPRAAIIAIYLVTLALVPIRALFNNPVTTALFPVIFALLFSFILLEQTYGEHSFWKAGSHRLLTSLGKISYGLYAYHMIAFFLILMATRYAFQVPFEISSPAWFAVRILTSLVITIALAVLSSWIMEQPILKFKQKFGYSKKELPGANSFSA